MNIKKYIIAAALTVFGFCGMSAQETVTEYQFQPHWYGQFQIGGQETLGEDSFGKLLSPNLQLGAGYQFNPIFGLRLSLNGWQSRAAMNVAGDHRWHWAYVSPMLDVTMNLTNTLFGYNPNRLVDFGIFAGIGANVAWHNNRAEAANANLATALGYDPVLQYLWSGSKAFFTGRFGANLDFKVTESLKAGLEFNANMLSDHYNSKKAGNIDWYFNLLVGVKYTFGPTYLAVENLIEKAAGEPIIVEKIVEKIVEAPPVEVFVEKEPTTFRRDIFFQINRYNIQLDEMLKVEEIAQFMKENPTSTVNITGYADKGTGTLAINLRLSKQRTEAVADALVYKYGIQRGRIFTSSMGPDEYQPFDLKGEETLNRVTICIATVH